ncbi:hypothetical protein BDV93DRAFT_612287 [Ceratobasidium sp. AG-I]|nr:hypothetical protein BDV93DRAFT_612287 [Ceratobasidium sp. AG-I]
MPRLRHSLSGQYNSLPGAVLLALPRDGRLALAYPSFDVINILEAKSLQFIQAIPIADAVPYSQEEATRVACVASDLDLNLLFGALGTRIGVWVPSSSFRSRNILRVHSVLSNQSHVRYMVSRKGLLAVVGRYEVTVYTLDIEQDLPKWHQTCKFKLLDCSKLEISPGLMRLACIQQGKHHVYVYSLENRRKLQTIKHPCQVINIAWRGSTSSNRTDTILYTVTADSTVRIFMPVLDSPDHLQLHASLDLHSFGISRGLQSASRICWLDRDAVAAALNKGFDRPLDGTPEEVEEEEARRSRLKHIVDEGWDLFALVSSDGTVVVRAITIVARQPCYTSSRHFIPPPRLCPIAPSSCPSTMNLRHPTPSY